VTSWFGFVRLRKLLSVIALAALTHSIHAQDGASAVLDDRQLEQRQARIGRIVVEVDDVFEREIRAGAYRLANALHVSTREETINEQLLFRSGDIYRRQVLDETERLLREQRYLNAVSIEPVSYHDDNTVDVKVRVHDVWTLSPGVSFGRKGGENSTKIELEDTNLFGLGKHIEFARSDNADRSAWRMKYVDPAVFGTWWQFGAAHSRLSDGRDTSATLAYPFKSLDSRRAFSVQGTDTQSTAARYDLGQAVDTFDLHRTAFEIGGGVSSGYRDGRALRYLGGYRYQRRDYAPLADASLVAPPPSDSVAFAAARTFSYPWVGIEWIEDEYLKARNLDQIGRTEDVYLGTRLHAEVGIGSTLLGATRDAVFLNGVAQSGWQLAGEQYLLGMAAFNGRLEGGALRNSQLDASARYYWRQSEHSVLFGALSAAKAWRLDPDEQLLLGGDNGLRGYPLRFQAGASRALATVEQRFYTDWQPLHLVNVGAAVFFDAGRVWGDDPVASPPVGWLKDVGVGLRLGNARSGLGNVIHFDIAFPLDTVEVGGREIKGMQLLIETRRSF
jgi:outer membrane protein assembly factor BamA